MLELLKNVVHVGIRGNGSYGEGSRGVRVNKKAGRVQGIFGCGESRSHRRSPGEGFGVCRGELW